MDLFETWKKLDDTKLSANTAGEIELPVRSKHVIAKLRRNYISRLCFAIFFIIIFVYLFIEFNDIYFRSVMVVVLAGYSLFLISSIRLVSNFQKELPVDGNLLDALRGTKNLIETDLRFETRVGITLYPFCGTAGFLLGYMVSGGEVTEIFSDKFILSLMIGVTAVFTPLGYLLGKWLHKKAYGHCLTELTAMIVELEAGRGS